MKIKRLHKNFFIMFGMDILLLMSSLYLSYLIRFDFEFSTKIWVRFKFVQVLAFLLIIKIFFFYLFDLYKGMWRYASITDLFNIVKALSVSTLSGYVFFLFSSRFQGFSRSIFIFDLVISIILVSSFRLAVRFYYQNAVPDKNRHNIIRFLKSFFTKKRTGSKNLLIIGAGDCGEHICREIHNNARLQCSIIGFLDDDPQKHGKQIHGIPVLGYIKDIKKIISTVKADEALIAIPSATSYQMRIIVEHCTESGINFKTMPNISELINGELDINSIRKVSYRDLLGREVIKLDEVLISAYIKGKTILVTGAGGSIGSELCRQICRYRPERIILFERAESPLCAIDLEIRQILGTGKVVPILGDIQDDNELQKVFEAYMPQLVFHAAAYKQVPILEMQPCKAIRNNIKGTLNLIEAANRFEVERFVFVSSDKAVRPSNIMGVTKRISEIMIENQNSCAQSTTRFMIVRFGNVAGSVGSVIPLFKKQIEKRGPVTVTHPEVTRYFMTIPEACQLILQASAMGTGGEIFILKMGLPIKIDDLARDLIRLSGYKPEIDIKVEYTGLRPGEKLCEELVTEGEDVILTNHKKIMVLRGSKCNIKLLNNKINKLLTIAEDYDMERIISISKEIVPEYTPSTYVMNLVKKQKEEQYKLERTKTETFQETIHKLSNIRYLHEKAQLRRQVN